MKYKIFIVDSNDIELEDVGSGNDDELGFAEIRDLAIDSFEADELSKCLQFMVGSVNNSVADELSKCLQFMVGLVNNSVADDNFYFVCDNEEEIILYY